MTTERAIHIGTLKNQSKVQLTSDEKKVLYVLNPEGDLFNSEKRLKPVLEKRIFWRGFSGKQPPNGVVAERLKEGYVYM